jgi:hypothetical protein
MVRSSSGHEQSDVAIASDDAEGGRSTPVEKKAASDTGDGDGAPEGGEAIRAGESGSPPARPSQPGEPPDGERPERP